MYLPALPAMTRSLHTTAFSAQLTLTAALVGLAVGQLVAGPVSDARGRRPVVIVGVTLYAAASLLCALSPSIWPLVGLRLVQGLAGAAGIVVARAVVRDRFSGNEAARFFALLMLVNGAAPLLAPLIGAGLLHLGSWRLVFVALAVLGALLALLAATALPETLPIELRHAGGLRATLTVFRELARDRPFVGYALSSGLVLASMFCYISGSTFVLQDVYGLSPGQFSIVFAINAFGIILAGQVSRSLVGRFTPRELLSAGIGASTLGGLAVLACVLITAGLPFLLPSLFVVVSSVGIVLPNATALALADHPRTAGSASALLGVAQYVLGGMAAPLVGVAGSRSAIPLGVLTALLGAGAVLVHRVLRPG
jgi:MFS transporter, DHA1 family, multidrug resistance protein